MAIDALTYADAQGALWATAVFALPLFCPGYCVGWAANVAGFRAMGWLERMAWSVALSMCVTPLIVVYLAKYGSMRWAMAAILVGAVCVVGLIGREGLKFAARSKKRWGFSWKLFALAAAWTAFALLSLIDVCRDGRMWMSVTVYDHALRTAFVDAVARTGVPPINPLYWPGAAAPFRYYYFWYVVAGLVVHLGHVTARQTMMASCVWAGFGLSAVIALYWRRFGGGARRRWMLWVGLIAVTGMDLIPALAQRAAGHALDADMEWWSNGGWVSSWVDTLLWVPHHAAALVCCMTCFLLAWLARDGRMRVRNAVLAGVGFASSFGLSVYVSVAFAMVMVFWGAWVLLWERRSAVRLVVVACAGVLAALLLAPYLRELHGGTSGAAGGERVLGFGVRSIIEPSPLNHLPGLLQMRALHPVREETLARLLLLAPGYAAELGFYGAVLLLAMWRWKRQDEAGRTAVVLAVAGLMVCSLVRSTVIDTNDFGLRGILVAQFFLLVLSGRWLENSRRSAGAWERWSLGGLLALGMMGTVYQAGMLRLYLPWREHRGDAAVMGLAEQSYALKQAYARMEGVVPRDAAVQFNPAPALRYLEFGQVMTLGRQMAASTSRDCGAAFGGDATACPEVAGRLVRLFSASDVDAAGALADCRRLGVDDLVVTRWDAPWQNRNGWAWTLPVAVELDAVRILKCK